jgi:hypothetical protein
MIAGMDYNLLTSRSQRFGLNEEPIANYSVASLGMLPKTNHRLCVPKTLFVASRKRVLPLPANLTRLYGSQCLPVFTSGKVSSLIVTTIAGAMRLLKSTALDSVEIRAIRHRTRSIPASANLAGARR